MFEFLGLRKSKPSTIQSPDIRPPDTNLARGQALTALAHELFRTMFRDVLNKFGIPVSWIAVKEISTSLEGIDMLHLVYLTVNESNDHLFRQLPALQKVLTLQLIASAPYGRPANYVFHWNFAPEVVSCAGNLPESDFWALKPNVPNLTQPVSPKAFDLPDSEYDHRSSGFAPTQPGEFN